MSGAVGARCRHLRVASAMASGVTGAKEDAGGEGVGSDGEGDGGESAVGWEGEGEEEGR